MRKMYNMILRAQYNNDARRLVDEMCNKTYEEVQKLLDKSLQEQPSLNSVSSAGVLVLDPEKSVTKGRRKRIKGHFEKRKSSTQKDFGTATPKKHII